MADIERVSTFDPLPTFTWFAFVRRLLAATASPSNAAGCPDRYDRGTVAFHFWMALGRNLLKVSRSRSACRSTGRMIIAIE